MSIESHLRVQALADISHRYGAIIAGLAAAIEDVLPGIDEESRARLVLAKCEASAQLASARDAINRALADLPEGTPPL